MTVAPQLGVVAAWATLQDLVQPVARPPQGTDVDGVDDQTLTRALLIASDVLFERTGRRWPGQVSNVLLRPQVAVIGDGSPLPRYGQNSAGSLGSFDYRYGGSGGSSYAFRTSGMPIYRGAAVSEVSLGVYPLIDVTQVKVDGAVLVHGTDYRVDDWRWLVRLGGASWPAWQDMTLDDTHLGTFSATVTGGSGPPRAGVNAAAVLAGELALAWARSDSCRLPRRVQTVARQGVTANFMDPTTLLEKGLTGIPEVDMFITTYNPKGIQRRATVHSVDHPRSVRRVTS